ncbi:MAG: metalloregulator ArsR/SmtB family transcription factor [Hyphomicrobiaceae bacterium]|nr:metalloregulator ArsR/SmtB family transcription factor [Hyphomicrobiaceae bacterium]
MRRNVYTLERIYGRTYISEMEKATTVFSTLADPIRLRALALIAEHGELCVCELVEALDLPQPKVSRHLAVLRDAGLLRDRRDAQWVLYALSPDLPAWVALAIDAAVAALENDALHLKDARRLARANRPQRMRCGKAA